MPRIAEAFVEISAKMDKLDRGLRQAVSKTTRAVNAIKLNLLGSVLPKITAGLTLGVLGIRKILDGVIGAIVRLGRVALRVFTNIIGLVTKLTLVMGGLVGVIGTLAVRAFAKQEAAEVAVAAALRATNQEVDANLERLKEQAAAIQAVTKVGDEMSLSLMATAIGMGVTADRADDVVKATIGLATALGQEANVAMLRYVVLAQQGETTMLRRYIPALRTAKDKAEEFAIFLKFVNEGFQRSQEEAQTTAGRFKQLTNAIGDLLEAVGQVITGSSPEDLLVRIRQQVEKLTENIKANAERIQNFVRRALNFINEVWSLSFKFIVENVDRALKKIRELLDALREFTLFDELGGSFVDKFVGAVEVAAIRSKFILIRHGDEAVKAITKHLLETPILGDIFLTGQQLRTGKIFNITTTEQAVEALEKAASDLAALRKLQERGELMDIKLRNFSASRVEGVFERFIQRLREMFSLGGGRRRPRLPGVPRLGGPDLSFTGAGDAAAQTPATIASLVQTVSTAIGSAKFGQEATRPIERRLENLEKQQKETLDRIWRIVQQQLDYLRRFSVPSTG